MLRIALVLFAFVLAGSGSGKGPDGATGAEGLRAAGNLANGLRSTAGV